MWSIYFTLPKYVPHLESCPTNEEGPDVGKSASSSCINAICCPAIVMLFVPISIDTVNATDTNDTEVGLGVGASVIGGS